MRQKHTPWHHKISLHLGLMGKSYKNYALFYSLSIRLITHWIKKINHKKHYFFHSLFQPKATYQISEWLVDSQLLAKLLKLLQRPSVPRLPTLPYVVTSKASFVMVSEPIRLKIDMKHLDDIINQFWASQAI